MRPAVLSCAFVVVVVVDIVVLVVVVVDVVVVDGLKNLFRVYLGFWYIDKILERMMDFFD